MIPLGTNQNQILFTALPAQANGIIPSVTVQVPASATGQTPGGLEFATYTTATGLTNYSNSLVTPLNPPYKTSVATLSGTGADNLQLSSTDQISAPGNTTINSLTLIGSTTLTINAGSTLTVASGSILMTGTTAGTPAIIGGGTLILGSTATPDGIITVGSGGIGVPNASISATIMVTNFTASNLTIAGGGTLTLPQSNPNLSSTGTGGLALLGGTALTIGSPLSLGSATLKLISGTFNTTIGITPALPNGLVLNNALGFFNSNVTIGTPLFPITFVGAVTFGGTSEQLTIPSGVTITLAGNITGSSAS